MNGIEEDVPEKLPDWLFRDHFPVVIELRNLIPRSLIHLGDDVRQCV